MQTPKLLFGVLFYLSVSGILSSCATNPATGGQDFVLMSEDQELALGRKFHRQIIEKYGRYQDEDLQRYVTDIGEPLAALSDRPELVFRFTLVDSQEVNAFALPGGYIYITRGMLAYLNSEAELAAVLSHEIGHVTARHSVQQYSTSTAVGVLGAVLASATGVRGADGLANLLGGAIVRGYGRTMELQADRLGAEYLARAGYRPTAMLDVIGILKDQESFEKKLAEEEAREPRIYHGLFSTHPDNDQRLREVIEAAQGLQPAGSEHDDHREQYLRKTVGLVFGDGEKEGIRRENNFYHRSLGFALTLPADWALENRTDRLLARRKDNSANLQLLVEDINRRITPRQFIDKRLDVANLTNGREISPDGLRGYTAVADLPVKRGHGKGRIAVIFLGDRAYIFAGTSQKEANFSAVDRKLLTAIDSFHALRPDEQKFAQPLRLATKQFQQGSSFTKLAKESRIPNHPESQLRLLNRFYPKGEPDVGMLIKTVE